MHVVNEKGIIHRDLKPANVLFAAEGTPKITDFGLAKKLEDVGETKSNAIMGTASYMAPEQARGNSKEVTRACDIYALGATLYECLTGRPPFKAATVADTLLQVITDEPAAPSELNPKIPRDLETICMKCLEKLPGKRFASAAELADDLESWRQGMPIIARPTGSFDRGWRWCRRNRMVASLLVCLTLSLLSGTAFPLTSGSRPMRLP